MRRPRSDIYLSGNDMGVATDPPNVIYYTLTLAKLEKNIESGF